jgi:hypothetical protein
VRALTVSAVGVCVVGAFCVIVCAEGGFSSSFVLRILTWLILPVVIRLSQRLSHACLSINTFVL